LLSSGATWRFRGAEVPVSGWYRVNSPEAVRESVNAGPGIGHGPEWLFEEGLRNGNLQLLLMQHTAPPVPVQIIYVANRLLPTRAVVFMDFIAEAFSKIPALNAPQLQVAQ
jgi:LysR family transcriptional regulator, regulator for bpeEF and oprC